MSKLHERTSRSLAAWAENIQQNKVQLEEDYCYLAAVQAGELVQITASIVDTGKVVLKKSDKRKEEPTVAATKAAIAADMAEGYGKVVGHQNL